VGARHVDYNNEIVPSALHGKPGGGGFADSGTFRSPGGMRSSSLITKPISGTIIWIELI